MKKIIVVFSFIALLSACGTATSNADKEKTFTEHDSDLTITTHIETGCKYIVFNYDGGNNGAGGIVPLMLPDGTQDCD